MKIPDWVVIKVQANPDYSLDIIFDDGLKKRYEARPILDKPIYADLHNPGLFLSARAECGTVVWNDDLDIAPEHLYECSKPLF